LANNPSDPEAGRKDCLPESWRKQNRRWMVAAVLWGGDILIGSSSNAKAELREFWTSAITAMIAAVWDVIN